MRQTSSGWARNVGMSEVYIDTYSLLGTSPDQPNPPVNEGVNAAPADLRYFGVQTYPVPAGFCSNNDSFVMAFAINTWDRQSHVNTTEFDVYLDTDSDGEADYVVFNFDLSLTGQLSDGRNVPVVLWDFDSSAYFSLSDDNIESQMMADGDVRLSIGVNNWDDPTEDQPKKRPL